MHRSSVYCLVLCFLAWITLSQNDFAEELFLDNGTVKVGIDPGKGASITWLSWAGYSSNMVNISDPGRLIQQSYYAGKILDRQSDGQHKAWSPWSWNPIQGGGVGSWARVREIKKIDATTLYAETIPKLWDMPNEEAQAVMRQWTSIEPSMPNVIVVRCEFESQRASDDRWGPAVSRPQEVPACYFTRNFRDIRSYLGQSQWNRETFPPGPPWGKVTPPRKSMAFFEESGQGVAVFSPCSTQAWNFGPHAGGNSKEPTAGPCMHVAPLDMVKIGPKSIYKFRYWLVVGNQDKIAEQLDALWTSHADERAELTAGPTQGQ
jgi:hypothetical protein